MKKIIFIISFLAILLSACVGIPNVPTANPSSVVNNNIGNETNSTTPNSLPQTALATESALIDSNNLAPQISTTPSSGLSQEEIDAILYMREEEKLARDVYLTLYNKWNLPLFNNIASSEQAHTDAIKTLITRYNLPDPFIDQIGVFSNPEIQDLYNQLVARGNQSLSEALKVGAAIEEIDIQDLEKRMTITSNTDIILVFQNLLYGSQNHLQAFVSTLQKQTGEGYQPQLLTPEEFQAIMSSTNRGNGGTQKP